MRSSTQTARELNRCWLKLSFITTSFPKCSRTPGPNHLYVYPGITINALKPLIQWHICLTYYVHVYTSITRVDATLRLCASIVFHMAKLRRGGGDSGSLALAVAFDAVVLSARIYGHRVKRARASCYAWRRRPESPHRSMREALCSRANVRGWCTCYGMRVSIVCVCVL